MKRHSIITCICGAAAVILAGCVLLYILPSKSSIMKICVGTYGENLYVYDFNTGNLKFALDRTAEAANPSYALMHEGHIYAVSETGEESGAYSFDATGTTIDKTADLKQTGADPCFVLIHDGQMMTADYSGGSVSVFPISDGKILDCCQTLEFEGRGPVKDRQESSHIHQLKAIPGTDWILASDLGADNIWIIRKDSDGLTPVWSIDCPAGSGPRHMEFSKDGRMLYCIAELSGNILVYSINHESSMRPEFSLIQEIQADEVNAGGSADIHIHPSGKYLYTSHRLDNDGIAAFSINEDGTLEKIGYSRTARHPRNFMITPEGGLMLVACRDDKVIQVFRISKDGTLTLTPSVLRFESDMPSSVTVSR